MFKIISSLFVAALVVGCATPATQKEMSVSAQEMVSAPNPSLRGQLVLGSVTGGKETSPLWSSQVDDQGFRGALEKSLAIAGYKADEASPGRYRVDAQLKDLDQPTAGFTYHVVSTVLYTVTAEGKKKQLTVVAIGSASTSDAFVGGERMRMANERSMKESIKKFLQWLGQSGAW